MTVTIKGQFLENSSYFSKKNNCNVPIVKIINDDKIIQINGAKCPPETKKLDIVEFTVRQYAWDGTIRCSVVQ